MTKTNLRCHTLYMIVVHTCHRVICETVSLRPAAWFTLQDIIIVPHATRVRPPRRPPRPGCNTPNTYSMHESYMYTAGVQYASFAHLNRLILALYRATIMVLAVTLPKSH